MSFDDLYRRVPLVLCQGKCWDACGSIICQEEEAQAMEALAPDTLPDRNDGHCKYLTTENRCAVYQARPLVCRMYGAAIGLECPYDCPSMGTLTRDQSHRLFEEANQRSPKVGLNDFASYVVKMWQDT